MVITQLMTAVSTPRKATNLEEARSQYAYEGQKVHSLLHSCVLLCHVGSGYSGCMSVHLQAPVSGQAVMGYSGVLCLQPQVTRQIVHAYTI